VIWDDHEKKNRTEITFNANNVIVNIKVRKDMLLVALKDKLFLFNFDSLKLIEQIETALNPHGLCGIATDEKPITKMIICPHPEKGALKTLVTLRILTH
jgi:hypothetical protein